MGIICNQVPNTQKIIYDCIGKGQECYIVSENEKLSKSLEKYMEKNEIVMKEINELSYNYQPIDKNKAIKELGIPDGGVIAIKLKSKFNN